MNNNTLIKERKNKGFTLIEIIMSVTILIIAVAAISTIIVSTQNSTTKRLTEADLQQQTVEIKETLHNEILTTNIGVKYWTKESEETKYIITNEDNVSSDKVEKVIAFYNIDRESFVLKKKYYQWIKKTKTLQTATVTENIQKEYVNNFSVSVDADIDSVIKDITNKKEWTVLSSNFESLTLDLKNAKENRLLTFDFEIKQDDVSYPTNDTVYVRNNIQTNLETYKIEKYHTIRVPRPSLKNTVFTYNGTKHCPTEMNFDERYMKHTESSVLSATNYGEYTITYTLKNKESTLWEDSGSSINSNADITLTWKIGQQPIYVTWGNTEWTYDKKEHNATYVVTGVENVEECDITLVNSKIGPDVETKTCRLNVGNKNFKLIGSPDVKLKINPKKCSAKVTLIEGVVYNGKSQKIADYDKNTLENGNLTYYISIDEETPSEELVTAPTCEAVNAGSYYVWYQIKATSSNYCDSGVIPCGLVKIKRQPIAAAECNNFVYDGKPHIANTKKSIGVVWSGALQKTNAGNYIAYAQPDANHLWPDETYTKKPISWTIEKATGSITPPEGADLTYNKTKQCLIKKAATTPYGEIKYKLDGDDWSSEFPKAINAGEYIVYYYSTGDANHSPTSQLNHIVVNIKKAKIDSEIVHPTANNLIYNGTKQQLMKAGTLPATDAKFLYSTTTKDPIVNGWSTNIPNGTESGKYTVNYYVPESKNYLQSDVYSIDVEIKKNPSAKFEYHSQLKFKYNYEIINSSGEEKVVYTPIEQDTRINCLNLASITGTYKASNAGKYTVNVTPKKNYAWSDGTSNTKTFNWEITKTKAQMIRNPKTVENARALPAGIKLVAEKGLSTSNIVLYSLDKNGPFTTNIPVGNTKGTYCVYFRAGGDNNFCDGDIGMISVELLQANATIETNPTAKTLTYNEQDQELISAGSANYGYMSYKIGNGSWSENIPKAKNAGNYTVYYKATGTDGSMDSETKNLSVTIKKATTTVSGIDFDYDGSKKYGIKCTENTITYCSGEYAATNVGTYNAKYTPDLNHTWEDGTTSEKTVTWHINRAKTAWIDSSGKISQEYTGGILYGLASYGYVNLSGYTSAISNGTYTFYATPDSNHAWADGTTGTKTVTWTIVRSYVKRGDSVYAKEWAPAADAATALLGSYAPGGRNGWYTVKYLYNVNSRSHIAEGVTVHFWYARDYVVAHLGNTGWCHLDRIRFEQR